MGRESQWGEGYGLSALLAGLAQEFRYHVVIPPATPADAEH